MWIHYTGLTLKSVLISIRVGINGYWECFLGKSIKLPIKCKYLSLSMLKYNNLHCFCWHLMFKKTTRNNTYVIFSFRLKLKYLLLLLASCVSNNETIRMSFSWQKYKITYKNWLFFSFPGSDYNNWHCFCWHQTSYVTKQHCHFLCTSIKLPI